MARAPLAQPWHPSLARTDHRPWGLSERPWAWRQTWRDLLFAHWPMAADDLVPLLPEQVTVQEFEGAAWLGVVPFRMTGVALRPLPDLPWISSFAELNVRTYVESDGKPGVWFFSLDAANRLAVWAARRWFDLPYFYADMVIEATESVFRYRSVRRRDPPGLTFDARYGPTSEPYESRPGTLEHWLTERYCLYAAAGDGRIRRVDIHHRPWTLQAAWAEIERNDLLTPHGLHVRDHPAVLHFSRQLDVIIWRPRVV
jgi:uncharacterized protein YqjF (DUF2071 family)